MITIQLTKMMPWTDSMKDYIWPVLSHNWLLAPSEGQSGGLITSWDTNTISILDNKISRRWIWFIGTLTPLNIVINIVNIYAPLSLSEKKRNVAGTT